MIDKPLLRTLMRQTQYRSIVFMQTLCLLYLSFPSFFSLKDIFPLLLFHIFPQIYISFLSRTANSLA